jgi:hypothetical protein
MTIPYLQKEAVLDGPAPLLHSPRRDRDLGCAYPMSGNADRRFCDTPRRAGSPYCPDHHALCHVQSGTNEETRRLREVEALANAVGGRRARDGAAPTRRFLKRLERALRES